MGRKLRKQIYLDPRQAAAIRCLASEMGTSEAEVIRQAIDNRIRSSPDHAAALRAWEREKAFIHSLFEEEPLTSERRWQRDDLYDRECLNRVEPRW